MDVFDLITTAEERYGNRTAIIDNDKEIDYKSVKIKFIYSCRGSS